MKRLLKNYWYLMIWAPVLTYFCVDSVHDGEPVLACVNGFLLGVTLATIGLGWWLIDPAHEGWMNTLNNWQNTLHEWQEEREQREAVKP